MDPHATTGGLTAAAPPASLAAAVKSEAQRIGFDLVGIAPAAAPAGLDEFRHWLAAGYAGEMEYLPRRERAYSHPDHVLEGVRSIIMLGTNYRTAEPAETSPASGRVSRYAWNDGDYHALVRQRLSLLADFLHRQSPGCRTRAVIDTAPLLERDFARAAGLGWFGKNTLLINKKQGSWLFLACLLTDLDLPPDQPHETSHCGTCTRCLDACPTGAFPAPYVLDARRCIAYLTIELDGAIPAELRDGMGEWLFGCDVCQDVCPWNKKAPAKNDPPFRPRPDLNPADLVSFLELDEPAFSRRFGATALARSGRAGLARNAAIVLGNRKSASAIPALARSLGDAEPAVRGAAAWALGSIGGSQALDALNSRRRVEDNAEVLIEIDRAAARI